MYSLNGIPLENPDQGWSYRPGKPLAMIVRRIATIQVNGRSGGRSPRAAHDVVPMMHKVFTHYSGLEPLLALCGQRPLTVSRTSDPTRNVDATLISTSYDDLAPDQLGEYIDLTITL